MGMLTRAFTEEKVAEAISSCGSSKSQWLDEFDLSYLNEFWEVYNMIVCVYWKNLCSWKLVRGLNSSFISLIPKKEAAMELYDYKPISLIDGIYKIISKVLIKGLAGF